MYSETFQKTREQNTSPVILMAEKFTGNQIEEEQVIEWLRENSEKVHEFCLGVSDNYSSEDRTTPILKLSGIIENLL